MIAAATGHVGQAHVALGHVDGVIRLAGVGRDELRVQGQGGLVIRPGAASSRSLRRGWESKFPTW